MKSVTLFGFVLVAKAINSEYIASHAGLLAIIFGVLVLFELMAYFIKIKKS